MWIVKKCETGHRQCVSVRQSVRQSLHPIRYIFHAVSQATGSLSHSPFLPLSCSVNHCIWLGYWHPFLMLLADNKEPNTKLSFLSLLLLLLGSLLCPDNNNNKLSTITTTATTTVAIIADNQSLHVFHFVFLQSFLAFFLFFDNAATGLNKSVSLSPDVIKY